MVNWNEYKDDQESGTEYDLPVPMSGYECQKYIASTREILELFEKDNDELEEEYLYSMSEGASLLEDLNPRELSQYSNVWANDAKMWIFEREILDTLRYNSESERKDNLMEACKEYIYLLQERAAEYKE